MVIPNRSQIARDRYITYRTKTRHIAVSGDNGRVRYLQQSTTKYKDLHQLIKFNHSSSSYNCIALRHTKRLSIQLP